jgi:hypothetical protein
MLLADYASDGTGLIAMVSTRTEDTIDRHENFTGSPIEGGAWIEDVPIVRIIIPSFTSR